MERRPINDIYDITIDGTVINKKNNKVSYGCIMKTGYVKMTLGQRKKGEPFKQYTVHRLVAMAFLGPPPAPNYDVDHIDRCKTNNHASNLRWVPRGINLENKGLYHHRDTPDKPHHIHYSKSHKKYVVHFQLKRFRHRSEYDTIEEAIAARDAIIAEHNL